MRERDVRGRTDYERHRALQADSVGDDEIRKGEEPLSSDAEGAPAVEQVDCAGAAVRAGAADGNSALL